MDSDTNKPEELDVNDSVEPISDEPSPFDVGVVGASGVNDRPAVMNMDDIMSGGDVVPAYGTTDADDAAPAYGVASPDDAMSANDVSYDDGFFSDDDVTPANGFKPVGSTAPADGYLPANGITPINDAIGTPAGDMAFDVGTTGPQDEGAGTGIMPDDVVLPPLNAQSFEPAPMGGAGQTAVMPSLAEQPMDANMQAKATKKKSVLNQPIGASKEKAFPTKTTMNLVQRDGKNVTVGKLVLFIVLAAIVLGIVGKFGFYDQFAAVSKAEKQTAVLQTQLDSLNASLKDYDTVASQYARYSSGYLNDDELSSVSRMDALALVDNHIRNSATVASVKISGNTMTVECTDITLAQAGMITDDLKTQSIVANVNLYTASLKADNTRGSASFVIDLQASTQTSQKS